MKSCSTFVSLLFATFSALNALAYQAEPQQSAAQPAASQRIPAQAAATQAKNAAPTTVAAGVTSSAAPPAAQPRIIPLGSTLVAEFAESLNVNKLKLGEKIKAKLAQDLISGGKLVARSGSNVLGHVSELKRRTKDDPESRLGVVFDKIQLNKHRELDFEAIVQAVAPPVLRRSRVDEPDQMMPPGVLSPSNSGPAGGNGSTTHSIAPMTTLNSSVVTLGPYASVQSNPTSSPGDSIGNAKKEVIHGGTPISGGVGMHGVYGMKNLRLAPPAPGANSGPAIVSTKANVKLQSGTQVIIMVVN